ncbi:MAG: phage holin family protein [Leucobacter sp.]
MAIALLVAFLVLPGFSLHVSGFFVALAVFAVTQLILSPLVLKLAERYAEWMSGAVGLVATLLALWIASLFPGGIGLKGVVTWVLAAVIIWLITAFGGWLVMKNVDKARARRAAEKKLGK